MVARIHIPVELHHSRVTARLSHGAHTGLLSCPQGERGVEQLHEDCAHVVAHPLVENRAHEAAVLFRSD